MSHRPLVVVAVDGSQASEPTVMLALGIAKQRDADVHAIQVDGEPERSGSRPVAVDFTVASAIALRTAVDLSTRHGARLTVLHAMQPPEYMVLSGAEAGRRRHQLPADAMMGVAPRTWVDQVVSGSTLHRVVRRAKAPVLVLPVVAGAHEWMWPERHPNRYMLA